MEYGKFRSTFSPRYYMYLPGPPALRARLPVIGVVAVLRVVLVLMFGSVGRAGPVVTIVTIMPELTILPDFNISLPFWPMIDATR